VYLGRNLTQNFEEGNPWCVRKSREICSENGDLINTGDLTKRNAVLTSKNGHSTNKLENRPTKMLVYWDLTDKNDG